MPEQGILLGQSRNERLQPLDLALPPGIPPLQPEDHLVLPRQCRSQARDFLLQFLPTRSFLRQEHPER
ncbi:MAG: hypothetical protein ACR2JC_06400 [Chloroflexota bacterium]